MTSRTVPVAILVAILTMAAVQMACGQSAAPALPGPAATPSGADAAAPQPQPTPLDPNPGRLQPAPPTPAGLRVTAGSGQLPNEQGQLYREYDISPYTLRVTSTKRPEQAIIDWILHETGYETWHGEPLAILSATPQTLRVYHTPQVQAVVGQIVARFVSVEAQVQAFSLRVVTVDSPSWRVGVRRLLVPVQTQSPGVQAWLLEREAAAMLMAELRRRGDYREHNSPNLSVTHGQPAQISARQGRNYVRDVQLRPEVWPGFEPRSTVVDEGFTLEFSPLLSVDGRSIDATVKCAIDQIEKLVPVMLDVPTPAAPRQRTKIEVPQMSHFRFHERFRWPSDQVLLISMGVVAVPVPGDGKSLIAGLQLPLPSSPARADLLVLIESRGKLGQAPQVTRGAPVGTAAPYNR
jgi:hypothetical protein